MNEPTTDPEGQYRETYALTEDEARPPYDRSAIRPNRDGTDLWMFIDTPRPQHSNSAR